MKALKNTLEDYKNNHQKATTEFEKGFLEGLNQAIGIIQDSIDIEKQEEELTED